jgi:hypothetical protein
VIETASELWTYWVDEKSFRPQDYDSDVLKCVAASLGDESITKSAIVQRLRNENWDARTLIRTVLPFVSTFSGMLRDLLKLYERIGATTTNRDSLRIEYEFESGDRLDESLSSFREVVRRTELTLSHAESFKFDPSHAWASSLSPYITHPLLAAANTLRVRVEDLDTVRFPDIVARFETENSALEPLVRRHRLIVQTALDQQSGRARHARGVREARSARSLSTDEDRLAHAIGDNWLAFQLGLLEELEFAISSVSPDKMQSLLAQYADWLEGFWESSAVTLEQQIEELSDVLSMPEWGKRHELYASWLCALMDEAYKQRLVFDVSDGVLAFPFRPTLLARIQADRGPVELWTEKKFKASDLAGHGRTDHIQPDYVFVDSATGACVMAVEAKQYKSKYSTNPGLAARDYAANLPGAEVLVVAHGPIRSKALDQVEPADRPRVRFHRDVRPGSEYAKRIFAEQLNEVLPLPLPSPPAVDRPIPGPSDKVRAVWDELQPRTRHHPALAAVTLRWVKTVKDLDLHIVDRVSGAVVDYSEPVARHAVLGPDAFDGGPESAILFASEGDLEVEVRLYSNDVDAIIKAEPVLTILTVHGAMEFRPSPQLEGRVWCAAVVQASGAVRAQLL